MKNLLFILIVFSSFSCHSSSSDKTQNVSCLEREWQEIGVDSISSNRKSFDLANDVDHYGGSYSCISYTTPYELNQFLRSLKTAIKENNLAKLEPLIYFPFVLIHEREIKGEKAKTTVIKSMEDFTPLYGKVFYPEMKRLIECVSLDKLATSPSSGIDAAYGSLIINRYAESRRLFLTSLSMDKPPIDKWLKEYCGN